MICHQHVIAETLSGSSFELWSIALLVALITVDLTVTSFFDCVSELIV